MSVLQEPSAIQTPCRAASCPLYTDNQPWLSYRNVVQHQKWKQKLTVSEVEQYNINPHFCTREYIRNNQQENTDVSQK